MLKQQYQVEELSEDPLANIFQEGIDEFILYQKQIPEEYKTKAQRNKEKILKLERDMNDPQLKKQRNSKRRRADKKKLHSILDNMNHQEASKFLEERKRMKILERQRAKQAMLSGQVFMIDLIFQSKMNGKENKSLAKQIELIFKGIKHVESPPSIHLCNFQGGIQEQLSKMGYQSWFMNTHIENISEVGKKLGKRLIYLSPDAEQPLEIVEQDCAYILGGLIDRTILKYASLNRARSLGIQARRLPIKQYMRSRTVLNLDHVIFMILKFRDSKDWKIAFDHAAPKRWKKDIDEKKQGGEQKQLSENQQSIESNEEEVKQQFQAKKKLNQNDSI